MIIFKHSENLLEIIGGHAASQGFNNLKVIPACHYFKTHRHNFTKHAMFTLIEQLSETSNVSKNTLRLQLK